MWFGFEDYAIFAAWAVCSFGVYGVCVVQFCSLVLVPRRMKSLWFPVVFTQSCVYLCSRDRVSLSRAYKLSSLDLILNSKKTIFVSLSNKAD